MFCLLVVDERHDSGGTAITSFLDTVPSYSGGDGARGGNIVLTREFQGDESFIKTLVSEVYIVGFVR